MDNQAVIAALRRLIDELTARVGELLALARVPGGPLEERADRQQAYLDRASDVNVQLLHLQARLRDRDLASLANRAVLPLSAEQSARMTAALVAVSRSIGAVQDFRAAIALAEGLTRAASDAGAVTGVA